MDYDSVQAGVTPWKSICFPSKRSLSRRTLVEIELKTFRIIRRLFYYF